MQTRPPGVEENMEILKANRAGAWVALSLSVCLGSGHGPGVLGSRPSLFVKGNKDTVSAVEEGGS